METNTLKDALVRRGRDIIILWSNKPKAFSRGYKVKTIRLEEARIEIGPGSEGMRVTFPVTTETGSYELWFESSDAQLVADRCDAAVVAMLSAAMVQGYDVIQSEMPISEELYYNLTYHVIPQLRLGGNRAKELKIDAPRTRSTFEASGVGTGMSLGIDSFATYAEYADPVDSPDYRITHFTYFRVGAHHGRDVELGRSSLSNQELYEGQLNRAREFCREYGYKLLVLDSNLGGFLTRAFEKISFRRSHTYRNVAAALMLQNVLGTYFYSSAYNLDLFELSLRADSAAYEKWLLPHLGTGSIRFLNSNRAWSRLEKTKIVSQTPASYRYLTVCLLGVKNCGKCFKCRKTLMALDALGDDVLDLYASSFDLDEYRAASRDEWFGSIYSRMAVPGFVGDDMKDIYRVAQQNHPSLVPPIDVEWPAEAWEVARVSATNASLRVEPTRAAVEIMQFRRSQLVEVLGSKSGWFKVRRDGVVGYIDPRQVEVLEIREEGAGATASVQSSTELFLLPSFRSKVLEELDEGSTLTVVRSLKRFYFVRTMAGTTGWVAIDSVELV